MHQRFVGIICFEHTFTQIQFVRCGNFISTRVAIFKPVLISGHLLPSEHDHGALFAITVRFCPIHRENLTVITIRGCCECPLVCSRQLTTGHDQLPDPMLAALNQRLSTSRCLPFFSFHWDCSGDVVVGGKGRSYVVCFFYHGGIELISV